jgi:hypothetical protein
VSNQTETDNNKKKKKAPRRPKTTASQKAEKKSEKKEAKKQSRKKVGKAIKRLKRWVTFIVLLGFTGFIAYTGWIHEIPEGYGGLIYTKVSYSEGKRTGGFDKILTLNDGLHWRWEKLLPTNLTMYPYPLDIKTAVLSSSGTLPSGDTYLAYLNESGSDRFNWEIRFTMTYKLNENQIPLLASQEGVFPDDLDDFFTRENQLMEGELYGMLKDLTPSENIQDKLSEIKSELSRKHPYIEITSLSPEVLTLPDIVFYEKARSLYFAYLDTRNDALEDMISQVAPKTAGNEEKMKVLQEYGKVLTEYPVLIDFFALDEDNDFGRYNPDDLMPEDLGKTE